MTEIKFEYGFESITGIVKKKYYLHEIPNIKEKCDVWNVLPITYVRQFTGLTDENGVEVYEGDIAIFSRIVCQIKWNKNFCGYTLNGTDRSISYWSIKDCKVIGNIYENPELIK